MKVVWLGLDDTGGCVLHWHDLRTYLREEHGVTVLDEKKTWTISELEDQYDPDWLVVDECNAKGYVGLRFDRPRTCKLAVREHDWWNRRRRNVWYPQEPELVLACYYRPPKSVPGLKDPLRELPGWRHIPHAVNARRFHSFSDRRDYWVGFYGKHGKMYENRTEARRVLLAMKDADLPIWVGKHSGYWHNGQGQNDGEDYAYNDLLAAKLRQCRMVWVDSPDRFGACVLKYFEAAAAGCLLFGEVPYEDSTKAVVPCLPEDIPATVMNYEAHPSAREIQAYKGWEEVTKHHSIPVRAKQIMELLECELPG